MLCLQSLVLICFSWLCVGNVHNRALHGDWTCTGCPENKDDRMHIYGAVTLSARIGVKDVYYPFNIDWFERIGKPGGKVHVKYVHIDRLADTNVNEDATKNGRRGNINSYLYPRNKTRENIRDKESGVTVESIMLEETLQVFVAHMDNPIDYDENRQAIVDDFLTMNPCLIPLHEPHIVERSTNFSNFVFESPLHSRLLSHVVVMVQLPIFGFGPTCSFYKHLVSHQFPRKCPSGSDGEEIKANYRVHVLSNAGYGGALVTMLEQVLYNVVQTPEKIFVVPSGSNVDKSWIWNAKEKCPNKIDTMDTWRCSFLPLSGCTHTVVDEHTTNKLKTEQSKLEYLNELSAKNIGFFQSIIGSDDEFSRENRLYYNDGYDTEDGILNWLRYRLFAFIQRPNAKFRALIRNQLKNIYMLEDPAKSPDHDVYQHHVKHVDELGSCVGLHVRNGDVWTDGRGPQGVIVDRSLNAHVYVANNMSLELGVQTIYLATDNSSIVSIAPVIYPEYKWLMLKRYIPEYRQGKSELHIHERDAQLELANIFADIIGISMCSALVSAFDSSFTRIVYFSMCSHNMAGICPPKGTVLREDLRGGDLPFAGAHPPPANYNWGGLARDSGQVCDDCHLMIGEKKTLHGNGSSSV